MKKHRVGEKDYVRLSRRGSDTEGTNQGGRRGSKPRKRTRVDQRSGGAERERVWRRWSPRSRQDRKSAYKVKRTTINGGKIRRDRGVTRTEVGKETGRYTRRGVETGGSREGIQGVLERREGEGRIRRRGRGRKGPSGGRTWIGTFQERETRGIPIDTIRESRTTAVKGRAPRGTESVREGVKKGYRRARRQGGRIPARQRARVRVDAETAKKTGGEGSPAPGECSTVGSAFALHARGHEFESRHFQ
jgi:hypothetical protein